MAPDEPHAGSAIPLEGTTRVRPTRRRLRFGMKSLMILPILAAVALVAVDRWTAIPWSGTNSGQPIIFKVLDGSTGQIITGASITMYQDGAKLFTMDAPFGIIRHFGGRRQGRGYRSLVRDTRRLDVGDLRIKVAADGFEDFEVGPAEISRDARPSLDETQVEYVIHLRRQAGRRASGR